MRGYFLFTTALELIKHPYSISRATSIDSDYGRLPTASVLSNKEKNYQRPISFDQEVQVFKATYCTEILKVEISRSMVLEALSW